MKSAAGFVLIQILSESLRHDTIRHIHTHTFGLALTEASIGAGCRLSQGVTGADRGKFRPRESETETRSPAIGCSSSCEQVEALAWSPLLGQPWT